MAFAALRFLKENGVKFAREGKNIGRGWVGIACPFCEGPGAGSMHAGFFAQGDGHFNCWKCQGHSLVDVVMALLKIPFPKAAEILKEYEGSGSGLKPRGVEINRPKTIALPGGGLQAIHKKYLRKRGFDPAYIEEKYKVTGTGISGDWKFRIIIPIFYRGDLASYQGRDITNKQESRYKFLADGLSVISPKDILYNLDNCDKNLPLFLFEGVMKVWRWGDGACCSFGMQMTDAQVKIVTAYKKVFIMFDPEKQAQQLAKKAGLKLSSLGIPCEVVDIGGRKGFDDYSEEEATEIRRQLV